MHRMNKAGRSRHASQPFMSPLSAGGQAMVVLWCALSHSPQLLQKDGCPSSCMHASSLSQAAAVGGSSAGLSAHRREPSDEQAGGALPKKGIRRGGRDAKGKERGVSKYVNN